MPDRFERLALVEQAWQVYIPTPAGNLVRALAEELLGGLRSRRPATDLARARLLELVGTGGRPCLPIVARRCAMSPRTLARRLAEEGSSFGDLVDEALRNQALCYDAESADRANSLTQAARKLDPLSRRETNDALTWRARVDAIAGDADDFVDAEKLAGWLGANAHIIAGADHFFSARHDELAAALRAVLD